MSGEDIPEGFHQFSGFLYPGSFDEYDSDDEWILANLRVLAAEHRQGVKTFLDKLLDGPYTDAQLAEIWDQTSPVYGFRPGYHRVFFQKIRSLIDLC
jgi:hypothetical protein